MEEDNNLYIDTAEPTGSYIINTQPLRATIEFRDKSNQPIGCFDFSESPATFTGDADESAKLFIKFILDYFNMVGLQALPHNNE